MGSKTTTSQAALFDAPADQRQAPLFGGLYMMPAELDEQPAAEPGEQPAAELVEPGEGGPLVIVGCGAGKLDRAAPAAELYTGQQFRACMAAARAITSPGRIRILSAAHGLLTLDQVTAPYDVKMGAIGSVTVHQLRQQAERAGLLGGHVIVLAGAAYTGLCRGVWPAAQTPLSGLAIGKQRAVLAGLRAAGRIEDQGDELAARRKARQRDAYIARSEEARDHRRFCLRCVDGKRCREGRRLDGEQRVAGDVYGAMMRGEL